MNWLSWIALGLLGGARGTPAPVPRREPAVAPPLPPDTHLRVGAEALARARGPTVPLQLYTTHALHPLAAGATHPPAKPPAGMVPPGAQPMAMDEDFGAFYNDSGVGGVTYSEGVHWLGFPYLAELAQRAEYRQIAETYARDMTRSWIKIHAAGEEDKGERIKQIEAAFDRHKVQHKFRRMAELDGFFGRGHLYIDMGVPMDDRDLMKTAIILDRRTVERGSLKNIQVVEPLWTYPGQYNAANPLAQDFYVPITWYVMGKEVHRSRLLTFVGREVPDMLKPSYSFGGLSMSQMAKPYVDNWLRTRQSVSDLVHSFSVFALATDMSGTLTGGGGQEERARAELFNLYRDNAGLFMFDKNREDFKNVSASLGTLDHLQAQSQEQICCLDGETLIETDRGQVPIRDVTISDKVMTRNGWAPLAWSGKTGHTTELIEITVSNGSVIRATAEHPIWIPAINEFVTAKSVKAGDRLLGARTWPTNMAPLLCGVDVGGESHEAATIAMSKVVDYYTAKFGRPIGDLFQTALTFITSMKTQVTISSTISPSLVDLITCAPMSSMAGLGSIRTQSFINDSAQSAEKTIKRSGRIEHFIAVQSANQRRGSGGLEKKIPDTVQFVDQFIKSLLALFTAGKSVDKRENNNIVVHTRIVIANESVYNLEVALGYLPEFYANGVLVHNSVAGIPLVIYTGITPTGLNTTSEGELQAWAQRVSSAQENLFRNHLDFVLRLVQLDLFGEIDPEITATFEPLKEESDEERANRTKAEAETDAAYVNMGALGPEDVRAVLADEEDGRYTAVDLTGPPPVNPMLEQDPLGQGGPGVGPPQSPFGGNQPQAPAARDTRQYALDIQNT